MSLCARCGTRCDTTAHTCYLAVVGTYVTAAQEPSTDYARGRADALRDAVAAVEGVREGAMPDESRGLTLAIEMLEMLAR